MPSPQLRLDEQLFMRIALQESEFEVAGIWRWVD